MTIQPPLQKTINDALEVLTAHKDTWVSLGIDDRIAILDEIKHDMLIVADRWIAASLHEKGIPAHSHGEGDEWGMLMSVFREVRLLRKSLIDISKSGRPQIKRYTVQPNGQVAAQANTKGTFLTN